MNHLEMENSKDKKYIVGMPKIVGKIKLLELKEQIKENNYDNNLRERKVTMKKKRGRTKVTIEGMYIDF